MRVLLAALALAAPAACSARSGDEMRVFAASSLTEVFGEIAEEFEAARPDLDVQLVLAGSASLAAQVADGAPGDVVATADGATMAQVVESGRPVDEPVVFATNRLVIVVPAGNPAGVDGLADLVDLDVAVCAVEVPCGAYAASTTAGGELTPISYERSVRGVVTKVLLGEVDAGIAYETDALAEPDLDAVDLPEAADVVARYPIVAIDDGATAAAFVEFVVSGPGRALLADAGFGLP